MPRRRASLRHRRIELVSTVGQGSAFTVVLPSKCVTPPARHPVQTAI